MEKLNKVLAEKVKKHLDTLARTKIQLIGLKKEKDPLTRVMEGMASLPELKERSILVRDFLKDLKDIQEAMND